MLNDAIFIPGTPEACDPDMTTKSATVTDAPTFAFGPYLYIPRRQLLLKSGKVVRLGCRALDLLTAFVRRPGELLTKSELMDEAWPSTTVVEGNLKVHIALLRCALEDDADLAKYIATVNGRGYRFIAPVTASEGSMAVAGLTQPQPLMDAIQPPTAGPSERRFHNILAMLTQAMRSAVIELPADAELGAMTAAPRRVLCIELAAQDEAWIESVFAQPKRVISGAL